MLSVERPKLKKIPVPKGRRKASQKMKINRRPRKNLGFEKPFELYRFYCEMQK